MQEVRGKYVPPAIYQGAFNCPHCGALAQQYWHIIKAESPKISGRPQVIRPEEIDDIMRKAQFMDDEEEKNKLFDFVNRMSAGKPFLEWTQGSVCKINVHNMWISKCFNCDELCVWVFESLVWPQPRIGPLPNTDLPDDVRNDYEEASKILALSPRGAAALLRLAIQKLCKELGGKGNKLDDDISALVQKGLDKQVQQALDVVRVVGNSAVHPGQIDLRDDHTTAYGLFNLVNLIAEMMISQPKHVDQMFNSLPDSARAAIERRDKPKNN